MKDHTAKDYQTRLQRVLDFIDAQPDGDLSLYGLSGVAAFSKFHFHRQFSATFGISVHRYVQLARFKRAAQQLAYRNVSITEIALACGYESSEAFARAFKRCTGQTPSEFRKLPAWTAWQDIYQPASNVRSTYMKREYRSDDVRRVDVSATRVALLEHHGDPARLADTIGRFIAWRRANGLPPKTSATFNIWFSDIRNTPPSDYREGVCAATERDIAPNEAGVVPFSIPAGRCALLRHIGSTDTLENAATYLYANWLPDSGEELRDFPPYCQRVAFGPDIPEGQTVTDIFLPLK